jgi:VanZ family protein
MAFFKRYAPAATIIWALIILTVSVIPGTDLPSLSIWEPDKVMHAFVYGVLTILLFYALQKAMFPRVNKIIFTTALCILYGFIIELIQLALPSRSFDMLDALANAIGCLAAMALILVISRQNKAANR